MGIASGTCPACGQGELFESWFVLRETCAVCGARFQRGEGTWIGSTVIGYTIGGVFGIGGGIVLIMADAYTNGRLVLLLAADMAIVVAAYPFYKAAWIGILHGMGKVYPD